MIVRKTTLCAALALAAACQSETDAPSAEQNREMDRAAEMLDEAPNGLSQVDDGGLLAEQERNAGQEGASGNE